MQRIILSIMLAVCLFTACDQSGRQDISGAGNPLSEWTLPLSVTAGGEGAVQWNGFEPGAALHLESSEGARYSLEIIVLTASGVSFRVPSEVPEGRYMLVLEQDGRTEMGEIQVKAMEMPVTGVKVASEAVPGTAVDIAGIGFEDGCVIVLVDSAGIEYVLETLLTYDGVSVVLPEELAEGEYDIYLIQDGCRWLVSDSFCIYSEIVVKELAALRYYAPYSGEDKLMLEWTISAEELTISEYLVESGVAQLNAYDTYALDADGDYVLAYDGMEVSNDMSMTYNMDSDGKVASTDVLRYGKSKPTLFTWTYDSEGRVTDISSPTTSFRQFTYEGGNMTSFHLTSFEYEQDGPVNNVAAPDVVWGYMALMEISEPFIYIPYFLGWYRQASAQLPARMVKPSPTGAGTVAYTLSYTFDEDGYADSMFWKEGNDEYIVEYIYR